MEQSTQSSPLNPDVLKKIKIGQNPVNNIPYQNTNTAKFLFKNTNGLFPNTLNSEADSNDYILSFLIIAGIVELLLNDSIFPDYPYSTINVNENNIFLDDTLKQQWNNLSFSYKLSIFNQIFFFDTDNDTLDTELTSVDTNISLGGQSNKFRGGGPSEDLNSFIEQKAQLEREASELNKEIVSIKSEISTARNEKATSDSTYEAALNELKIRETTDPLNEKLIINQEEMDRLNIQQLKEIDDFLNKYPPDQSSIDPIIQAYYKDNNLTAFKNTLLEKIQINKDDAMELLSKELEKGDGKVPNIDQIKKLVSLLKASTENLSEYPPEIQELFDKANLLIAKFNSEQPLEVEEDDSPYEDIARDYPEDIQTTIDITDKANRENPKFAEIKGFDDTKTKSSIESIEEQDIFKENLEKVINSKDKSNGLINPDIYPVIDEMKSSGLLTIKKDVNKLTKSEILNNILTFLVSTLKTATDLKPSEKSLFESSIKKIEDSGLIKVKDIQQTYLNSEIPSYSESQTIQQGKDRREESRRLGKEQNLEDIKQKILDYRTRNNGTIVSNDNNIMQKIDFKDRYSLPFNFIKLLSLVFNVPETVIGLQEISQKRPNNNINYNELFRLIPRITNTLVLIIARFEENSDLINELIDPSIPDDDYLNLPAESELESSEVASQPPELQPSISGSELDAELDQRLANLRRTGGGPGDRSANQLVSIQKIYTLIYYVNFQIKNILINNPELNTDMDKINYQNIKRQRVLMEISKNINKDDKIEIPNILLGLPKNFIDEKGTLNDEQTEQALNEDLDKRLRALQSGGTPEEINDLEDKFTEIMEKINPNYLNLIINANNILTNRLDIKIWQSIYMSSEIIEKIKEFQIYPLSNFNQELQGMINGSYMEAIKNNLSKQLFTIDIPNNPLNIKKVSNIKQRLFGMQGGSDEEIVMVGGANQISGKDLINYVTEKIQNNPLLEIKCIYTIFKLISSFYDYKSKLIGSILNINIENLSYTKPDLYYQSQINKPLPVTAPVATPVAIPVATPVATPVARPVATPVATQRPVKSLSQTFKDSYRSNYNAIRPKLGPMRKKAQPETKQKLPTQQEVDPRLTDPDYGRFAGRGLGGGLNEENPNSFETLFYINSSIDNDNDTLEILKVYYEYIYCLYIQNPNNKLLKDLINIVLIQNLELDETEIKTLLNKYTEFNSLHSIYNNIIENTKDSVPLHQRIFGKSKSTSSIPPSITPLAKAPSLESPQPSETVPDPRLFDPDYGRYGYGGGLIGGSNMNNRWFEAALNTTNKVNVIPTIQKMSGAQGGLDSPGRLDGTINMLSDKILSN